MPIVKNRQGFHNESILPTSEVHPRTFDDFDSILSGTESRVAQQIRTGRFQTGHEAEVFVNESSHFT